MSPTVGLRWPAACYGRQSLAQKAIRVTSSARNRPRVCLRSGFRLEFQGIHGIFLEKHREQPQDRHIEAERTTAAFMLLVTEVSVGGLAARALCSSN